MKKKAPLAEVYGPTHTCISLRISTLEGVTEEELFRYVLTVLTGEDEDSLDKTAFDVLDHSAEPLIVKRTR